MPPSSSAPVTFNREFSRECVKFFGEIVEIFSVPPSVGQIYGLLYASPVPLAFSDIFEQLEISKGSASQGLQLLKSLGAVKSIESTDNRREYFEPELSLRQLVSGILRERIAPMAAAGGDRLKRMREIVEDDSRANEFCLDRVEQLETWRRRLKTVLPILTTLLGPKRKP